MRLLIFGAFCLSLASGCAAHVAARAPEYTRAPQWHRVPQFTVVMQAKSNECAAAVAQMVANRWGKRLVAPPIPQDSKHGIVALALERALKEAGLEAFTISGRIADLENEVAAGRPVIVGTTTAKSHWRYGHYKIVVGVSEEQKKLLLVDPMAGYVVQSYAEFESTWQPSGRVTIVSAPAVSRAGAVTLGSGSGCCQRLSP